MARNRNKTMQGNRLMLQWGTAYYYPPKTPTDIQDVVSSTHGLTANDIKQKLIDEHKFEYLDDETDKLTWYEENGYMFKMRDGKSDVYTKGGYDAELIEMLERQYGERVKWRIETNTTLKFEPMGKVFIGGKNDGKEMVIAKVLNIETSGSRENKYLAMRNYNYIEEYATKMLILI